MAWTIRIHYTTGDSFGSERTKDELGMAWESLDKAIDGLKAVRDHYNAIQDVQRTRNPSEREIVRSKYLPEYWAVESSDFDFEYNLNMVKDDGTLHKVYAFWMGYFEQLHQAEIVPYGGDNELVLSYEFY